MYTIKIKVTGFKNVKKTIKFVTKRVSKNIPLIAREVRDIMRLKAVGARSPGTGKLANAIRKEVIKGGWGVGNMDRMTKSVPYWYVVDKGMLFGTNIPYVPPTTRGFFGTAGAPASGASGERFTHDGSGFLLSPKKPISPLNYTNAAFIHIASGNFAKAKQILLKGLPFKNT